MVLRIETTSESSHEADQKRLMKRDSTDRDCRSNRLCRNKNLRMDLGRIGSFGGARIARHEGKGASMFGGMLGKVHRRWVV